MRAPQATARARALRRRPPCLHAPSVDAAARFPSEAFAEIEKQRLLGVQVPEALGGEGATVAELADVCFILGQVARRARSFSQCTKSKWHASSAMRRPMPALERILARWQPSNCCWPPRRPKDRPAATCARARPPVERDGDEVTLERKATVISYAVEADGIVTTARRAPDAAGHRPGAAGAPQEGLHTGAAAVVGHPRHAWHSQRRVHIARAGAAQADTAPSLTRRSTRRPWCRSRICCGARCGRESPRPPPQRRRLSCAMRCARPAARAAGRARISPRPHRRLADPARCAGPERCAAIRRSWTDEKALASLEFQTMITLTKVQAPSSLSPRYCAHCAHADCPGIATTGVQHRPHLRDILSAPLMINNDRILANLAMTSLMTPLPTSISG